MIVCQVCNRKGVTKWRQCHLYYTKNGYYVGGGYPGLIRRCRYCGGKQWKGKYDDSFKDFSQVEFKQDWPKRIEDPEKGFEIKSSWTNLT